MISGAALSKLKEKAGGMKGLSNLNLGVEGWASGNGDGDKKKEKPPIFDAITKAIGTGAPMSLLSKTYNISPENLLKIKKFNETGEGADDVFIKSYFKSKESADGGEKTGTVPTKLKSIAEVDPAIAPSPTNLGNEPLNTQANWLDTWYAGRANKFGFGFTPEMKKPTFLGNKEMGKYVRGEYEPSNKEIYINSEFPNSAESSTYLHEKNHFYQDKFLPVMQNIKGEIPKIIEGGKEGISEYLGNPKEVHSRLMQLRYDKKLTPEQVITPEVLKTITPEERKKYKLDVGDTQLMDLLNKTVSVQKKDTSNLA
jgi:hypothetical protein